MSADPGPAIETGERESLPLLKAIQRRQVTVAALYERVNNPAAIAQLFGRLPEEPVEEGPDPEDRCPDFAGRQPLTQYQKTCIASRQDELMSREDLSEDERTVLRYLTLDPRLLLIIENEESRLDFLFDEDCFRCLSCNGRALHTTIVINAVEDANSR